MSTTITLLAMLDIRLRFVVGKCGLCVIVVCKIYKAFPTSR